MVPSKQLQAIKDIIIQIQRRFDSQNRREIDWNMRNEPIRIPRCLRIKPRMLHDSIHLPLSIHSKGENRYRHSLGRIDRQHLSDQILGDGIHITRDRKDTRFDF